MDSIEELPKRIIKFRVWQPIEKQMRSHDWLHSAQVVYNALFNPNRKDIHVMQFTNEYYSDGTEAYEGDIYEYSYEYDSDYDGDMPIVKKSIGKGLVKHISDTWQILEAKKEGGTVKVIGNLYQNPDLL